MSSIFGIWNYSGVPIIKEDISEFTKAHQYWPADGQGKWTKDNIFLGHLMNHNTPESLLEILPYQDCESSIVITSDARIDNRDELFTKLKIEYHRRAGLADSQLILE